MSANAERELHAQVSRGDSSGAVVRMLELYGPEVAAFQRLYVRADALADDAFAIFCARLWQSVGQFDPERGSARAFLFAIARNTALNLLRHERAQRRQPLEPHIETLVALCRPSTPAYLRSEVKAVFAEIREQLDPEDQALLAMRVEAAQEWTDIAAVLLPDEPDRARAAARLRKRFERVKRRLRELMQSAGVLGTDHERG